MIFLKFIYFHIFIAINILNICAQQSSVKQSYTCLCDYDISTNILITCPSNLRIHFTKAVLYDDITHDIYGNCSDNVYNFQYMNVLNQLQRKCVNVVNCSIEPPFFNTIDTTNLSCLSVKIEWICFTPTNTQTSPQDSTTYDSWSFTYFFYIITLVLSTSCIIISAIFLLRRFLLLRRNVHTRRARILGRTSRNGNSLYNIWVTSRFENYNMEETRPPPSYDNIYDQSTPINPPPSYTYVLNNKKKDANNANSSDKIAENTIQQQQQQQPESNEDTTRSTTVIINQDTNTNVTSNSQTPTDENTNDSTNNTNKRHGELNLAFNDESSPSVATTVVNTNEENKK